MFSLYVHQNSVNNIVLMDFSSLRRVEAVAVVICHSSRPLENGHFN